MNFATGAPVSNAATVAVGNDGAIQVRSTTATDMVVDVQGYYTAGTPGAGGYVPVAPIRVVDTRNATGLPEAPLAGGTTTTVQLGGLAGVPANASSVMANFTITGDSATSGHYFTPFAADQHNPGTAFKFSNGPDDATSAPVGLSTTTGSIGAIKVYLSGTGYYTDLTVDVVGYFTAASSGAGFTPAELRILDTRVSPSIPIASGVSRIVTVAGVNGIPASGVATIVMNLATIDAGSAVSGYVSAFPDGTPRPVPYTSLTYHGGATLSNMVISQVGASGSVDIYNSGPDTINVVVDVEGWYSAALGMAEVDSVNYPELSWSTPSNTLADFAIIADPAATSITYSLDGAASATVTGSTANVQLSGAYDAGPAHILGCHIRRFRRRVPARVVLFLHRQCTERSDFCIS